MTSAIQRLQANEDDTIWRQNAPIIRQLYQEERKTLKEVKEIMENEKRFPVTPLSIWEVRLRGLRMQKKLKARDWSLVYQHVRPRLQHEGKKKLRKPTAFLINGTQKPWDEVWKEIRRNCALGRRPHQGPLPPLPRGIVIRTPSPELIETTLRRQQSKSPHSLVLQLFQTTLVSLQSLLKSDSQLKPELGDTLKYSESVYRLCLEGLPFTILLENISDIIQRALPSSPTASRLEESQDERVTSALSSSDNLTVSKRTTLWKSQLTWMSCQLLAGSKPVSPRGQDLGPHFDSHHYLSMVIYLLSNHLVHQGPSTHEASLSTILQMTFKFVPRRLLLAIFQSRLPSIKAAWEKLLLGAGRLKNKEAFRFLLSVGMDNDWLDEQSRGHEYLFYAALMNCSDIIHDLLGRSCRPTSAPVWCFEESMIVEALRHGNLDCTKLLIQHYDFNHHFPTGVESDGSRVFVNFITSFEDTNQDHLHCLRFLLERGADVDYIIDPKHPMQHNEWYWSEAAACGFMDDWPLSILDYVYYFHRPLFPMLAVYSKVPSRFSRAKALWELERGVGFLREYAKLDLDIGKPSREGTENITNRASVRERKIHCLEILLAEQFLLVIFGVDETFCWKTVHGLLNLEIDFTWLFKEHSINTEHGMSRNEWLAAKVVCAMAYLMTSGERPDKEHGWQILQWLLSQGFQIKANTLLLAVEDHGIAVLDCLASFCRDLKKEGAKALAEAIFNTDFQATKWLLDRGVDPNSKVFQFSRETNIFEIAAEGSTLDMMKYLDQRGARPRIWDQCGQSSYILKNMLSSINAPHVDDLLMRVQYIVEKHVAIKDSCSSAHLLEICLATDHPNREQRRTIFEFLWKKGARLGPGSPLAVWIGTGGGHQLVGEMLDAGADPNAHSFDRSIQWHGQRQTPLQAAARIGDHTLVCLLLERGADVNRPAVGDYRGMTALQAICAWDPVRQEERQRKENIITLLLHKGANVNDTNCRGHTALIYAAQLGDLSSAFLLLKHGAEVNMTTRLSNLPWTGTALDTAAFNGRLDMVEFLLNANALSSSAFSDGEDYDAAIRLARGAGHFVVSELICKHSVDRKRWDVPYGQAVEASFPSEHTPQPLSLRAKLGTASWPQTERRLTSSENVQGVIVLNQSNDLNYALAEGMVDSSTIVMSKANGQGMSRAEATGVGWDLSDRRDGGHTTISRHWARKA